MAKIGLIGVLMDMGAVRKGVDMGPLAIRHAGLKMKIRNIGHQLVDHGDISPLVATEEGDPNLRYAREINEANERLYRTVNNCYEAGEFPIILGGDHSIAAGSISSSAEKYKKVGVIWIDAHGDFNDETISPSGNLHGMPLSALCGYGPDSMVHYAGTRVDPKNVVIIGARALDPLEAKKLRESPVTIYSISDVHSMGMETIIEEAIRIAGAGTNGIHLSFDMDAIDPTQAPGVGTPVYNGLTQREAFIACERLYDSDKLIAIDLVETNPLLDDRNATGILASELLLTCLGKTDYHS